MLPEIATLVGIFGSVLIVVAYFFTNQQRQLDSQHWLFPLANLAGATFILGSLYFQPNLPAALIEIFWIIISWYALAKSSKGGSGVTNTESAATSEGSSPQPSTLAASLATASELKDFAVRRGLPVPDKTLTDLSQVRAAIEANQIKENLGARLDMIIRDLTTVTWPTTIHTLAFTSGRIRVSFFQRHFRTMLFVLLGLSLILSITGSILMKSAPSIGSHLVALSLGLLGSTTYVFFNLTNVVSEGAFDESDVFSSYARLMLGPAFGWLFFQIFDSMVSSSANQKSLVLLVSFAAGFSTRLVIGIINQSIQAIEITLGMGDKRRELKSRANRK